MISAIATYPDAKVPKTPKTSRPGCYAGDGRHYPAVPPRLALIISGPLFLGAGFTCRTTAFLLLLRNPLDTAAFTGLSPYPGSLKKTRPATYSFIAIFFCNLP
ncbi:MAG: hypothetical protein VR69_14035 [Peptococcaceae bacterium BRH_c4b]|nr:MAG: hypothetical protein VR69_14035 [Peptococcaceae bacterium BRH_c4b]